MLSDLLAVNLNEVNRLDENANNINIDKEKEIDNKKIQFLIKRIFDILVSLIGIIIMIPIFLIIILLIKIDSPMAT